MGIADSINELGRLCQDRGQLQLARFLYACATTLAPEWSAAWFNRGLIAKFQRRWPASRAFNLRAAELDPNDPPVWWNLGIAATVLQDWPTARKAWSRYGLDVPPGEGPIDMRMGAVPIRVSPDERPEVLWCQRLDPARAVIRSVPTPGSGRGCGDVLLTDGEPRGTRMHGEREVSVFNELEVLDPSLLQTFEVRVMAPAMADVDDLESSLVEDELVLEDWTSSIQHLCHQCSEGSPHDHHPVEEPARAWQAERAIGVAARTEEAVRSAVAAWVARGGGRQLVAIECVLKRA